LIRLIPHRRAEQLARRSSTEARVRKLDWFARLGALVFAQLTDCASLRALLHHVEELPFVRRALRIDRLAKSTLTDALEKPVGELFRAVLNDLVGRLGQVAQAQRRRGGRRRWSELLTLIDSTHMSLCLSMFEWARSKDDQAAVKLHIAYDLYLRAPEQFLVTEGHVHDRNPKVVFTVEKGRTYVFDRGYFDLDYFDEIRDAGAHFVTRVKRSVRVLKYGARRRTDDCVLADLDVTLGSDGDARMLRLVRYRDPETHRVYEFITDRFDLSATSIADAYKARWQVELFFRFLKQHLRIKRFFGTSREAVEAQLYAALVAYVLVEIVRRIGQGAVGSLLAVLRSIRVALTTAHVEAEWFKRLHASPHLHLLLAEELL
jgi:putative transposase